MTDHTLAIVVFIVALVVGVVMIGVVIVVYYRHRKFGLGGSVLTVFGVVLIGMSVWRTIDVSIDLNGIKTRLEQVESKVSQVEQLTVQNQRSVQQAVEAVRTLQQEVVNTPHIPLATPAPAPIKKKH